MRFLFMLWKAFFNNPDHLQVVPNTGFTKWLTTFTAGAMSFLAVVGLAFSLICSDLSNEWGESLKNSSLRLSAPTDLLEKQTKVALAILEQTSGVKSARLVGISAKKKLLEPWLGVDFPLEAIAMPALIEIHETEAGVDYEGLRLRLSAELPSAILDNHAEWRRPIEVVSKLVSQLGMFTVILIMLSSIAMVTMASNAALSANVKVLRVLRLVGAFDTFIVTSFVRIFTLRIFLGSLTGTVCAGIVLFLIPTYSENLGILDVVSLEIKDTIYIACVPFLFAIISIFATRNAVKFSLNRLV
ncbi:cell division protein FtsX [Paracoccaceae bacterium]|nr:cell division protein FtsX [Paracoccaceae bacterium]MDC3205302.1 cell division protein FtsX [Paracoccaceae bacterium]